MAVSWHSFDLKTGRRGLRLNTRNQGTVSRILNEATESSIDVRIWDQGAPVPGWDAATAKGLTMLVAVNDDDDTPMWGGMVYRRRGNGAEWVTVDMTTLEAYLDRRFVNTGLVYTNADQIEDIAYGVLNHTMVDGDGIEFTLDTPHSNWRRDRTYVVDDDKTILSVMQELAEVENGIEFTVDLGWVDDDHTVLDRIIRVRNRVGTAYTGTVGSPSTHPQATFNMPGSVIDFEYIEDFSPENGANGVVAVSSGEGDTRPESDMHIAAHTAYDGGGWPLFEHRYTPSTSIITKSVLDEHASRTVAEMWDGMNELTLSARMDVAPQVGSDWFMGDDVAVSLTSARFPERMDSDGAVVPGYVAIVRCIGWEIDFDAQVVRPRLLETRPVDVERLA